MTDESTETISNLAEGTFYLNEGSATMGYLPLVKLNDDTNEWIAVQGVYEAPTEEHDAPGWTFDTARPAQNVRFRRFMEAEEVNVVQATPCPHQPSEVTVRSVFAAVLRQRHSGLIEADNRYVAAQRRAQSAIEQTERLRREHSEWTERITERLHRLADDNEWCETFDSEMEEFGLRRRTKMWDVQVSLEDHITLTVQASSEADAIEAARNVDRDVIEKAVREFMEGSYFDIKDVENVEQADD